MEELQHKITKQYDLTFKKKLNKTQWKPFNFSFVVFGMFDGSVQDVFWKHMIVIDNSIIKFLQTVVKLRCKIV